MADMPNLEELLKQTSLRFAKSQSGAFILPFRTKSLGESVVWVGLSADGEWIGIRHGLRATLPENATDQSSFFRRLLEINETLAMAKILVQDKVVAVGTELDYKGATPEQLEVAVRVVVSAAADVTQQLSQNADPLVQAP